MNLEGHGDVERGVVFCTLKAITRMPKATMALNWTHQRQEVFKSSRLRHYTHDSELMGQSNDSCRVSEAPFWHGARHGASPTGGH